MENLSKEVEKLKEKLKDVESENTDLKGALHIVTVHCCHLIKEKEGKEISDIYKEISGSVSKLMSGR